MTATTHQQDGSFYTMLAVGGSVVQSRWHSTAAGAKRWADKMIASHAAGA